MYGLLLEPRMDDVETSWTRCKWRNNKEATSPRADRLSKRCTHSMASPFAVVEKVVECKIMFDNSLILRKHQTDFLLIKRVANTDIAYILI